MRFFLCHWHLRHEDNADGFSSPHTRCCLAETRKKPTDIAGRSAVRYVYLRAAVFGTRPPNRTLAFKGKKRLISQVCPTITEISTSVTSICREFLRKMSACNGSKSKCINSTIK